LHQGLSRLTEGGIDIVLLDLALPDAHGLETLVQLREQEADVPVVVLTGMNDEALAIASLQAGAQDYLRKGQTDSELITRSIRYSIERHRLLRSASLFDELTGLYNRRGFRTLSEQQLKVAQRAAIDCLLIYIDLDNLKAINDTLGHHQVHKPFPMPPEFSGRVSAMQTF
jgi:PleD family two-component response regulator